LLLDVPKGSRFSLIDLVAIEHEIGDEAGIVTGAVLRRSLKKPLAQRIVDDAIDVF